MVPGGVLRIQATQPFRLRITKDEWQRATDQVSTPTGLGVQFVDVPVPEEQRTPIRFTFWWTGPGSWEGRDFCVATSPDR